MKKKIKEEVADIKEVVKEEVKEVKKPLVKLNVIKNWWGNKDEYGVPKEVQDVYGEADKGTHYFWCSSDPNRIRVKTDMGYTLCKAELCDLKGREAEEKSAQVDSLVRFKGLVLMCIPQESWVLRGEQLEKKIVSNLNRNQKSNLATAAGSIDSRLSVVGDIIHD